jgi:hypothetical protein
MEFDMKPSVDVNVNPGFLGTLCLIFITLKLTNYIDWSWWWVLAPIWIPLAFVLFAWIVILIAIAFGAKISMKRIMK